MNLFVIIPAYNEEKTIVSVIRPLIQANYQVIVVDDCSCDNTALLAEANGATVLQNIKNLGAWKSTQAGMRYAYQRNADVVITMDADGQHRTEDIPSLIAEYQAGTDVVIGSCLSRGSLIRHLAWRVFKKVNRLQIDDITSGFRLYSNSALYILVSRQATMLEYQCVGILIMLRNMRLNVAEIPVKMHNRTDGISRIFHSWKAVFYYLAYSGLLSITKVLPVKKDVFIKKIKH